jgi:hypothetical protein
MVIETKETFGTEDIVTVELICKNCNSITILPFNNMKEFSQRCANCGVVFIKDFNDPLSGHLRNLESSFSYFNKTKEENSFNLRFSLKESK